MKSCELKMLLGKASKLVPEEMVPKICACSQCLVDLRNVGNEQEMLELIPLTSSLSV